MTYASRALKGLVSFKTGKLDSNAAKSDGEYPFFTCSRETFRTGTYSFDDCAVLLAGNNASGDFPIKYYEGKFDAYQRTYIIRPMDPRELSVRYLYFSLSRQLENMKRLSTGAATKFLTLGILDSIQIPVPPLPTQRRIASILSAYDDLIENNTRRIAILEEMARSLYREWFVHFRFPGHEKVKLVDSELGKIPEGWQVVPFRNLVEKHLGGDWGEEEPDQKHSAGVLVLRGTDFPDFAYGTPSRIPKRYVEPKSLERRRLNVGDLVLENSINAKARCSGSTVLIDRRLARQPSICASFCKLIRLNDPEMAAFVLAHLRHLHSEAALEKYQNVATNGIANFQMERFLERHSLVLPCDADIGGRFYTTFSCVAATLSSLAAKNALLHQTRDLLLPKLISGEIDVDSLDLPEPS